MVRDICMDPVIAAPPSCLALGSALAPLLTACWGKLGGASRPAGGGGADRFFKPFHERRGIQLSASVSTMRMNFLNASRHSKRMEAVTLTGKDPRS